VLVVVASARRRGAEVEGVALAEWLTARGRPASAVALGPGGTNALAVTVLGASARAWKTLRALRRAVRGRVVIAYGSDTLPLVALATLGLRVPWIYRSIGDPAAWTRGRLHRMRTAVLMCRAARVVTLWDGAAESMHRLYRVRRSRLHVIANRRPAASFTPVSPAERERARAAHAVEGKTVLFLGALTAEKQPLDAVRAVAALDGVHLLVVGEGPLADDVAALGARLAPGRVRLLGVTEDPACVIAAADVLVLTSRTEGMPGVVMEARMRGIPVVATNVGAVASMLREGVDGLLVPAGAPAAATAALARVLSQPETFRPAAPAGDPDAPFVAWEELLKGLGAV
jgi:glycosyltransferase involved in cell wall biosynthesis